MADDDTSKLDALARRGLGVINNVKVYSTENCPRCEQLKRLLRSYGIRYGEVDMSTPEALTELRMNGIFTLTAPVLQVGDDFFVP
ncbi:MAG: glutaredoxin family protein [Methanosarcinales archaeon Met12]|nr:MAG: glutaredoxin family protein [Methanosarcinales archaeon Met12]